MAGGGGAGWGGGFFFFPPSGYRGGRGAGPWAGGAAGNFTADAGVPTLDGLGTSGEFLHNPNEYIHIDHIARRTALTAKLLQAL